MKFTPIIDKNVVLHDSSKKIHVSFDDVEPMDIVTEATKSKKRSHPAHDNDGAKVKKAKSEKKDKKDKKDKKNKKKKKDGKEKKVGSVKETIPVPAVVEIKPAVEKKKPIEKKAAAIAIGTPITPTNEETPIKVRGPKFTPKKVKTKKYQPSKKLTQEEVLAKVAAVRKKKALKRQAKVKVNGETINKPAFHIDPTALTSTQLMPTKQLGEFVLYALSETTNLPWCNIINKAQIQHVVMIYAQGLSPSFFGINDKLQSIVDLDQLNSNEWIGKASMPFLTKASKYMITNEISGKNGRFNSPVADILQCNMSNSKKERLAKEQQQKQTLFKGSMREFYVLSHEDLKRADYPIPPFLDSTVTLPDGWKETHASLEPIKDGQPKRIIAVDCEMVLTVAGSSLARITLIDEDGTKLLDELVKPDQPIIDYLTKYSGITPAAMSMATCSLRRAQKHVRKLVDHDTILVGHGLENDLKALHLAHPYCVDTSLLYDHHRGPPYKPSLRFLARNYLKRHIQDRNDSHIGHDSAEDARATLDLFKLKLANKPSFGRFKQTELIMDRLLDFKPSRSSAILESSKQDYRSFGSTQGGDYFRVDTDEELVDLTLEKIKETNFLFTRYQTASAHAPAETKPRDHEDGAVPDILPSSAAGQDYQDRANRLQKMDSYIRTIYHGLPENTFLIVSGGVNDIPAYKTLYDKHTRYQEKYASKKAGSIEIPENEQWTEQDQQNLCNYAAQARRSSSFFMFKR